MAHGQSSNVSEITCRTCRGSGRFAQRRGDEPDAARARGTGIRKSTLISMLPRVSCEARFALARDAGFEESRCAPSSRTKKRRIIRDASKKTGLKIHSVMNVEHQCRAALER